MTAASAAEMPARFRHANVPTAVLEHQLRHAEEESDSWTRSADIARERLATAERRARQESDYAGELRGELLRRGVAVDDEGVDGAQPIERRA